MYLYARIRVRRYILADSARPGAGFRLQISGVVRQNLALTRVVTR